MRNKSTVFPCMENPPRCYLNCTWNKKCLSSDKTREVWLAEERDMWCEWYILPSNNADSFYLQNVKTKYFLSISSEQNKLMTSEDCCDPWFMEQHPTVHGAYFIIHERNGEPLGGGDSSRFILPPSKEEEEEEETKLPEKSKNVWAIEGLTGELCFISSANNSRNEYIGCDFVGKLYTTPNSKGWEVWRFVEAGEGFIKISSWTHQNKIICSDRTGKVYTVDTKQPTLPGGVEKWKVERAPVSSCNGVIIQNPSTDRFLQWTTKKDNNNNELRTTDTFDESSCVWHLTAANRNRYFLLSVLLEKRLVTNKTQPFIKKNMISKDVDWTVKSITDDDGAFAFYADKYDRYLGSDENGNVSVSPNLQDYEKWFIQETDNEKFYIISKTHHRFLAVDNNNNNNNNNKQKRHHQNNQIHTVSKLDEDNIDSCVWCLHASMPLTLSSKQLYSTTIAGAAGLATGMAILAPVTAGFAAAGDLFLGPIAAAAAGTMVGKTVYNASLGSAMPIGKNNNVGQNNMNMEDNSTLYETSKNRPFCAWETW